MSEELKEIITYLQSIQSDLVGIVIPAIIAAVVSLLSLAVSNITSAIRDKDKYNHAQYVYMQKVYPQLRNHLQKMELLLMAAAENEHYFGESISTALLEYYKYKSDSNTKDTEERTKELYNFIDVIDKYIEEIKELYEFFQKSVLPAPPLMHRIIRKRSHEMLGTLLYWSSFLIQFVETPLAEDLVHNKLLSCKLDADQIRKYIIKSQKNKPNGLN